MDNLIINISKEASTELKERLFKNPEYSCITLQYISKCGSASSVEMILDEFKSGMIIEEKDNVFFSYHERLSTIIKSIEIIYDNSDFKIKVIPVNSKTKECTNNKNCSSKCDKTNKCGNCNGCPKKLNTDS